MHRVLSEWKTKTWSRASNDALQSGYHDLTYQERLRKLDVLSFEHLRKEAGVVFIFKCMMQWQDLALERKLACSYRSTTSEMGSAALSLNNLSLYPYKVTVYKSLYSGSAKDKVFSLVSLNMRANGVKLVQRRTKTHATSSLFSSRTSSSWNNLPLKISLSNSFSV